MIYYVGKTVSLIHELQSSSELRFSEIIIINKIAKSGTLVEAVCSVAH
jgi:hypothetical protein